MTTKEVQVVEDMYEHIEKLEAHIKTWVGYPYAVASVPDSSAVKRAAKELVR